MGIAYNIVHLDFRLKLGFVILRLFREGRTKNSLAFHSDNRDQIAWPTGIFLMDHLPGCPYPDWPTESDALASGRLISEGQTFEAMPVNDEDPLLPIIEELSHELPLLSADSMV